MIFGDTVRPAGTTVSADWIGPARRASMGTVGALVPDSYSSILRVHAPPPISGDWWSTYRELYQLVAEIGARHTSSANRAWFAVWEGHGFDTASTQVAWRHGPVDDAERRARDTERARLRDADRRRNAAIRLSLSEVPRFDLPDRTYYLLEAPVAAVAGLRDPSAGHWRNPDMFWPDDRRWFVATDVDFWSLYVGGDDDLIADLENSVATRTETVTLAHQLEIED